MNYKKFLLILLAVCSCTTVEKSSQKNILFTDNIFSSKGFTLVFNETHKKNKIINKKLEKRSLVVFQRKN